MSNKIQSVRDIIKLTSDKLHLLEELERSLINEQYKFRLVEHQNPTRYSLYINETNNIVRGLNHVTKSYLISKIERYGAENINLDGVQLWEIIEAEIQFLDEEEPETQLFCTMPHEAVKYWVNDKKIFFYGDPRPYTGNQMEDWRVLQIIH